MLEAVLGGRQICCVVHHVWVLRGHAAKISGSSPCSSHWPHQLLWELCLHGIFIEKRKAECLEKAPTSQHFCLVFISHAAAGPGVSFADLKAPQEGCECPCPALLRLCRAGTFTPHLIPAAQVPPISPEVAVTQIPQWETEQEPSPDRPPALQTDPQLSRQDELFLARPSSLPSDSPGAELMKFSTSVPQLRA